MITMKKLQECHALAVELMMMKTALDRLKKSGVALGNEPGVSAAHIAHIENSILTIEQKRAPMLCELNTFLAAVDDLQICIVMRLHYLCGFYWDEVAALAGEKSGDALSTRVYKYCRSIMRSSASPRRQKEIPKNAHVAFCNLTFELAHLMTMRKALCKSIESCGGLLESSPEIGTVMKHDLQMLNKQITALKTLRTNQTSAITSHISRVVPCRVQAYMNLHFIHGLTWDEVAYFTDATSGAAVRQRVHTHISKAQTISCRETTASQRWAEPLRTFRERSIALSEQERLLRTLQAHTSDQNAVDIFQQRPLCDIPEELRRLRSEIVLLRSEQETNILEVNALIASVSDTDAREYMKLFYVQGLSWESVAMAAHAQSGEAARVRAWQYTCGIATLSST